MLKSVQLLIAVIVAAALGACTIHEEKHVQPVVSDAPPAASSTTTTHIGF